MSALLKKISSIFQHRKSVDGEKDFRRLIERRIKPQNHCRDVVFSNIEKSICGMEDKTCCKDETIVS